MSQTVLLGFQTNTSAKVTFFNLAIPKDAKDHKVSALLDKATNGGNPVKVPDDFHVDEVMISKTADLSSNGTVKVEWFIGIQDRKDSVTLNSSKTDAKINVAAGLVTVHASK